MFDTVSREALKKALVQNDALSASIMADQGMSQGEIAKAISTGTGLVGYDLQAPAKNLYPVNAPIIKTIPRDGTRATGTATNWKQVSGLTGSGFDATPWVPEGQRAANMSYTTANKAASYVTIGEEDYVTYEGISAAQGFEDVQATMTMRLLQKAMLKEEDAVLLGNNSVALGTPTAPTLAASGSGSSLTNTLYSVIVVALSAEGYKNAKPTPNAAVTALPKSKTVTGMDGNTFVLNGGSSNKSGNTTITPTAGQVISATTPAIAGAVAYAWYFGAGAGNETLQFITTINSATFSSVIAGGENASAVTADCSTNSTAYNGLLNTAFNSGSGAYVSTFATGTAGVGTVLTSSGRGSVNEIDTMLQSMWDNYQVTASVIYVNSQELRNITAKVLASGTGSLLQYRSEATEQAAEYALVAGGTIEFYYNPFLGKKIPIKIHPRLAPGTILAFAADLPVQYQTSEVPNVVEMRVRRDWYQIEWPLRTRRREVGVYCEQVLAVYAPFAMGVLNNIGNG
jgi:hypothetical protein